MMQTPSTPVSLPSQKTTVFLHGRAHTAGRVIWGFFAIISLIALLGTLALGIEELRHPSPETFAMLDEINLSVDVYAAYFVACAVLYAAVFIVVSVIIFWRRSDDAFALFVSIVFITLGCRGGVFNPAFDPSFLGHPVLQLCVAIIGVVSWSGFIPFFFLFPDGRFVPRWTITFAVIWVLVIGIPWNATLPYYPPGESPLAPDNLPIWINLLFSSEWIAGFYAQYYRYRHISSPVQRQQTKWFVVAIGVMLFMIILVFIPELLRSFYGSGDSDLIFKMSSALIYDSIALVPLFIGISILRYRLWDVDLVINRGLVYLLVTTVMVVFFVAVALVLQAILGKEQSGLATIISVVGVGILFNPTRRYLQGIVDRKVYGFRFDQNELNRAQHKPEVKNLGALTGRIIGGYELLDVIGKGGMGEVYKGFKDGQTSAIKILPDNLASQPEFRGRFEREARALASLDHPNIVKIYGSGVVDGVCYIAMELVSGQELNSLLRERGIFSLPEAQDMIANLAAALGYAHSQGIVHRDIKPSNVMVRLKADHETYEAVLMDFGVAKLQDSGTRYTGTGAIGTIDYMSPEQIMTAREVDHLSDVYALGVMLYEMLTGERPFKGSPAQVMFAHIQQPAPDPRDISPDIPLSIAKAIQKALEKHPQDRFQSVGDFASALIQMT